MSNQSRDTHKSARRENIEREEGRELDTKGSSAINPRTRRENKEGGRVWILVTV